MPLRHTFIVIQGLSRNAKVRSDPQGDNKFNHDDDLPAFFVAVTPRVLYHGIDHVHPQCDQQSLRNSKQKKKDFQRDAKHSSGWSESSTTTIDSNNMGLEAN